MDEKFEFSYLENFPHSKNLDGMEKLEKSKLNPLSSQKFKQALTARLPSHSPNLNGENETHRVENTGLYT